MPAPIILPLLIKGIVWLGTAGIAAYGVKKVTEVFGSTPANDAKQIPQLERMSPKELYQDRKDWRKDRINYHKKKGKKIQEKIDELNRKIELENEEKAKVLKKIEETNDPAEKERLRQKVAGMDKNIAGFQKEISDLKKDKEKTEKSIDEVYNKYDDNLTQEQFVAQSNSINWTSYKNWGIIIFCVVIMFILIGFIRKLLAGFASSLKG